MDVCLRSFGFRLWAEGPLGFRRGDVSVLGFRQVLGLRLKSCGFRASVVFLRFGSGEGEFRV